MQNYKKKAGGAGKKGYKKNAPEKDIRSVSFFLTKSERELSLGDSVAGANRSAAAAADASIGIDVVFSLAFGDSLYGAYGDTSTAAHAVVANYISQSSNVFRVMLELV